jgi:hypothetical protein
MVRAWAIIEDRLQAFSTERCSPLRMREEKKKYRRKETRSAAATMAWQRSSHHFPSARPFSTPPEPPAPSSMSAIAVPESRPLGQPRSQVRRACKPCRETHGACDEVRPCRRCTLKDIVSQCGGDEDAAGGGRSATPSSLGSPPRVRVWAPPDPRTLPRPSSSSLSSSSSSRSSSLSLSSASAAASVSRICIRSFGWLC